MYIGSSWSPECITPKRGWLKCKPYQKFRLILIRRQTSHNAAGAARRKDPTELLIAPSRIANLRRNSQQQQVNFQTAAQAESCSEIVLQLRGIAVGRSRESVRKHEVRHALRKPANLIEIHACVDERTDRPNTTEAL